MISYILKFFDMAGVDLVSEVGTGAESIFLIDDQICGAGSASSGKPYAVLCMPGFVEYNQTYISDFVFIRAH